LKKGVIKFVFPSEDMPFYFTDDKYDQCTRAVCKVRGLTLLFRVGTVWRCGDGLFSHPLLENVLQDFDNFEISCLFTVRKAQKSYGARSELNSVFGLEKLDQWSPIRTTAIQSRSHPHAISELFQP
jgi:hypothetical protein